MCDKIQDTIPYMTCAKYTIVYNTLDRMFHVRFKKHKTVVSEAFMYAADAITKAEKIIKAEK